MQKYFKAKNDAMFKAIFCNENNRDLLTRLLEDILDTRIIIKKVSVPELIKKNIYVKGKTLDVLVETDSEEINIEVNSYSNKVLRRRNASYIFSRYANNVEVGSSYLKMPKFIQVNLTSETDSGIPDVAKYTLLDPNTCEQYIDNLIIYEFNLPRIKESCYNKNSKYKFIALLDANKEELTKLSNGDKLMEKFKSEVDNLNSDEKFVKFLSDEKETELLINTYRDEGYDKGLEQGLEQGTLQEKQKIAREMLNEELPISVISKCTKLSKEEIEALK